MSLGKQSIEYGGFLPRFAAILFDFFILLPVNLFTLTLFGSSPLIATIVNIFVNGLYYAEFLAGNWQATPGKRILNLHVISTRHAGPLSREEAWLRYIAYHLPTLPLYSTILPQGAPELITFSMILIWFIPILTHQEKCGVHDHISKTRVIVGRID